MKNEKKLSAREISQNKILELITQQKDSLFWRQPWFAKNLKRGAINGDTLKAYRGQNNFLLTLASQGYTMPVWATRAQWQNKGRQIKPEEKLRSMPSIFAAPFKKTETDDSGEERTKTFSVFRHSSVFNIAQTEIVDVELAAKHEAILNKVLNIRDEMYTPRHHDPIESAETLIKNNPMIHLTIKIEGERACYRPLNDSISVPPSTLYTNINEYYSTYFHELVHATGSSQRLNREKGVFFGDHKYSREELVAEFGAAMLCAESGIDCPESLENSAAYIASWHSKLKSNPDFLSYAIKHANEAVDYFLNKEPITYKKEKAEAVCA